MLIKSHLTSFYIALDAVSIPLLFSSKLFCAELARSGYTKKAFNYAAKYLKLELIYYILFSSRIK